MHVAARDRDAERAQRVLHPHRAAVGSEDLRQALVHLGRRVRAAVDEYDALRADAPARRRPGFSCSSTHTS
jgi:hypothetical protein